MNFYFPSSLKKWASWKSELDHSLKYLLFIYISQTAEDLAWDDKVLKKTYIRKNDILDSILQISSYWSYF